MDQVEEQLIKAQCQELILRFALLNDTQQYEELTALFVKDGVFFRPLKPNDGLAGRRAIFEDLNAKPTGLKSFHVCTNILVSVHSATQASGVTYFTVYLGSQSPSEQGRPAPFEGKIYVGQYIDEFRRYDQQWYFQSRRGRNNFYIKEQSHV